MNVFCSECGEELEVIYIESEDDEYYKVCYCHVTVEPCKNGCKKGDDDD